MIKRPIERPIDEPGRPLDDGSRVRGKEAPGERPSLIGKTLSGKYEIDRKLGEGGLGDVFVARQLPLGREVALKLLRENLQHKDTLRQRFEREARMLAQLKHPNIVHLFDFDTCEHGAYIVMDRVEGVTLSELVGRGPLLPSRAIAMMSQVLRALEYAHQQGVIHRDLKPGNIMVREGSDHVVVLDFGLARLVGDAEGTQLTRQGAVLGTPAYMAPEQATGDRADARADVYSAGLVLFEMLAGRRAFLESEPADLLRAHLMTPPPTLADVGVHASRELEAFIARALSKRPQERWADAVAMAKALATLPPIPPEMDRLPKVVKRPKGTPAAEAPATVMRPKSDRGSSDEGGSLLVAPVIRAPAPLPGPSPKALAEEQARKAKEEARLAKEAAARAKEEAKKQAQEEAKRKAQEEAKRKAEADAKRAEADAKRAKDETKKAKEETKRAKDEAKRAKEEAKKAAALAKKQAAKAAAARPPKKAARPGRKTSKLAFLVALALLGGIAYGGVWLATRPTAPEADRPRNAPPTAGAPASSRRGETPRAARPAGPKPPAKNPFSAGVPADLAKLRRRIARGGQPSRREYSVAVAYSRDHADDPRGELLLAHTFADRHWWSDSLAKYRSAYARDPSCRGDPTMLPDLLKIVVTDSLHREGAAAIDEIYGAEALPEVERAITRAEGVERDRLTALRARLRRR